MQCFAFFNLNYFFFLKILSEKTLFRDSKAALLTLKMLTESRPKLPVKIRSFK
jgi:hypothetical protein